MWPRHGRIAGLVISVARDCHGVCCCWVACRSHWNGHAAAVHVIATLVRVYFYGV